MKLLVGLGNPGEKYARTRHNIGFMAVEAIAARHKFGPWKKKFQGYAADGEIAGEKVLLLKPETFMNESGRSVGEAARFLKVAPADIIVFHDELDLAPGKLKIKAGGGNAGHNGLRSLSAHIGNEYARVRMGIGHPGSKDAVVHYVLHDFAKADAEWLRDVLDAIADAAPRLAAGDQARFLTDVARKLGASTEPEPKPAKALPPRTALPSAEPAPAPARPHGTTPAPRHPAGERAGKRQSAIAENLKKWLAARDKGD